MRKVILYIAASLDGYVADKSGGVEWINGDGSDTSNGGSYLDFLSTVDTVFLGEKTYLQIVNELSPDSWPYKGKKTYVLTEKNLKSDEEIIFTSKDITCLVSGLRSEDGLNIWVCGGAYLANSFINKGLIDEYHMSVIPVLLGGGIKLFEEFDVTRELKLKSTLTYNGIVDLVYESR